MNKDSDIYLLMEDIPREQELFLSEQRVKFISTEEIPLSGTSKMFQSMNKMDPSIASGLWVYALMRFFVLFDFMQAYGVERVVHLENDTMLYVDFQEVGYLFEELKIAAPFQSRAACIPSFVYIKDASCLQLLIEHILKEIGDYTGTMPELQCNDMRALASFYRKKGRDHMTPLPTLMPGYYAKNRSIMVEDHGTDLTFLAMNAPLFPGYLFDAAGLGIFMDGTLHSRVLFQPRLFSFFWDKDSQGRSIPCLAFKGVHYKIMNLHFHAKKVENYTSFQENR